MEQNPIPSPRSSGIPRLSKLPVPKGLERSPSNHDPIKYTFKSRLGAAKSPQSLFTAPTSKEAENSGTTQPSGSDNKPANDLESASQDEAAFSGAAPVKAHTLPRRPRPSLSDRAIETLSQVPPSPSPRRRKSGFFPPESPSKPSSRPISSLNHSRPGTSHSHHPRLPTGFSSRPTSPIKRHLAPTTGNQIPANTPSRRSISSYHPSSATKPIALPNGTGLSAPSEAVSSVSNNFSQTTRSGDKTQSKSLLRPVAGSKTLSARPTKPRPSAQDVFTRPPAKPNGTSGNQSASQSGADLLPGAVDNAEAVPCFTSLHKSSSTNVSDTNVLLHGLEACASQKKPNSSAALRETIAKAKAARQIAARTQMKGIKGAERQMEVFPDLHFGDKASILRDRVAGARTNGRLNIAALGLKKIPPEVMNMYNANLGNSAWYESVDLVRLIAADNEFEYLEDTAFPDEPLDSHEDEDEYQGNLFGGLETFDLHGNCLKALPTGLRRLERLTTLNLSKNRLNNGCISIISHVQSLRELHLADNNITGTLDVELCALKGLEVLDLHNNSISALPSTLHQLCYLRTINVTGNKLESLPFECFSSLRLVEINAARNRLSGTLFPSGVQGLATLKVLDVSNNALIFISQTPCIDFPSLQSLNVTENRLTALPDISTWTELLSLSAAGNQLASLPEGFVNLSRLKAADFSRNDIRKVDERLGLMDCLTMLRLANNPLRERRFLRMETEEIKRELKALLLPDDATGAGKDQSENAVGSIVSNRSAETSMIWLVKPGGILDRSSTGLESIEPADMKTITENNDIKALVLNCNRIQKLPQAIEVLSDSLTRLGITHNRLSGANYFGGTLTLPNLKFLDLSVNAISSLSPVVDNLAAPKLAELNMSRNRLTSLLPLRKTYPSLLSFLVADNSICVLDVEAARGLQVLNVSGNELDHLDPKLGLLGAEGLRWLIIGGNKFRVPKRDIIDKGTEAVLTWLSSRIPVEDM